MKHIVFLLFSLNILLLQAQDSAIVYYQLGKEQYDANEYDKAVTSLTKSIGIQPTDSAFMQRAVSWRNANKAILDYDTALMLNPNNWYALLSRGNDYNYLKNYRAALKDFKSAIKMQPDSSQGYYRLGFTLYLQKKYTQAIAQYTKAIEKRKDFDELYYWRGMAYYVLKDYKSTITDLDKAEMLNKMKYNLIGIYITRSFAKSFLGDKQGECEDLHKAANLGQEEAKKKYLKKCL